MARPCCGTFLTRTNTAAIEGHRWIFSVVFSPDGTTLAVASTNQTVRLWDVATQTLLATLEGHRHLVSSVAFSPDGITLASGSFDSTVKLWDISTKTNIATLEGHVGYVNSVAFSPDGTLLASGAEDGVIKLWDISTETNIAMLEGHVGYVNSVAFLPNGTILASGSGDKTVKLWDVVTSENFVTMRGPKSVHSVAFSPDGTLLASGAEDGVIKLWDMSEWIQPRPRRPWTLVKISGDEQEGSSGEALMNPFIVEVRDQYGNPFQSAQVTFTVTEGEGRLSGRFTVENVMTDANGRAQNTLTLGPNPRTNIVEASVAGIEATFKAVGIETSTTPIARNNYQTWHLPDGALIRLGKGGNRAIAFSPDGQIFAVASSIGVWLYDVVTTRKLALLTGHAGIVTSVSFLPMGKPSRQGQVMKRSSYGMWQRNKTSPHWRDIQIGSIQFRFLPMGKPSRQGQVMKRSSYGMWQRNKTSPCLRGIQVSSLQFRFLPMGKPSRQGQVMKRSSYGCGNETKHRHTGGTYR